MVVFHHGGEEFTDEVEVGDCVDGEHAFVLAGGRFEDGFTGSNAGIVEEDGWVANGAANFFADFGDLIGLGEVALEEMRC